MTRHRPAPAAPPLLLHVFPSFAVGGAQVRFAAIANRFGPRWRHAVVALDGETGCAGRLGPQVDLPLLPAPYPRGLGAGARLWRILRLLRALRPALLVTSNWGSIEWAAATLRPEKNHGRLLHALVPLGQGGPQVLQREEAMFQAHAGLMDGLIGSTARA